METFYFRKRIVFGILDTTFMRLLARQSSNLLQGMRKCQYHDIYTIEIAEQNRRT